MFKIEWIKTGNLMNKDTLVIHNGWLKLSLATIEVNDWRKDKGQFCLSFLDFFSAAKDPIYFDALSEAMRQAESFFIMMFASASRDMLDFSKAREAKGAKYFSITPFQTIKYSVYSPYFILRRVYVMKKIVILFAWWLTIHDFTGGPVTKVIHGPFKTLEECQEASAKREDNHFFRLQPRCNLIIR